MERTWLGGLRWLGRFAKARLRAALHKAVLPYVV